MFTSCKVNRKTYAYYIYGSLIQITIWICKSMIDQIFTIQISYMINHTNIIYDLTIQI